MINLLVGLAVGFLLARIPSGNLPHPKDWRWHISWWWRSRQCARGRHPKDQVFPNDSGTAWCESCERTFRPRKAAA